MTKGRDLTTASYSGFYLFIYFSDFFFLHFKYIHMITKVEHILGHERSQKTAEYKIT
jgi:hypothetical protein